jgi:hypothetical protein
VRVSSQWGFTVAAGLQPTGYHRVAFSKIKTNMILTRKVGRASVVDPDPHSFGCPGSRSGSVLLMRIRIQEHRKWKKFTNKLWTWFLAFQKGFCRYLSSMFLTYYLLFHVKIKLLVTLKSDQDPDSDPLWFGSLDPDPHWDKKLDSDPHWKQCRFTTLARSQEPRVCMLGLNPGFLRCTYTLAVRAVTR